MKPKQTEKTAQASLIDKLRGPPEAARSDVSLTLPEERARLTGGV